MTDRQPPSLGELLDHALKRSKLTQNAAAAAAGISGPRWRQIANGYETKAGMRIPVVGPDETVARMALAVGVTSDALRAAGRDGAANELEDMVEEFNPDNPFAKTEVAEGLATYSNEELLSEVARRVAFYQPATPGVLIKLHRERQPAPTNDGGYDPDIHERYAADPDKAPTDEDLRARSDSDGT
jgi:hypothetical protein